MILARKFLIPASILFVLLAAGLFTVFSAELSFQLQAGELRQDGVLQQAFEARLQALEDLTESLAVQAAADPRIQAALAAADREALLAEVQPLVEAQSSSFPAGYTFHLPAAVEFLSTDGPEAAGEDPSQARSYIADAIAGNRTVQVLDIGESGLAVLTVVPVVSRGQVVGSVTAGLPLGRALLDELKAVYGHEWQLYLAQDQAIGGGPSADHVDRRFAAPFVIGTPQHFPVDRNHLAAHGLPHRRDPTQKAGLELLRVQAGKHPGEGVMRRDAVG